MPGLVVVALVGILCLFNLVLTYGVIRRLRVHSELLSQRSPGLPDIILGPGSKVGAFSASTVDGDAVDADGLPSGTMVGFFSPDCVACAEQLPDFVAAAAAHPGGKGRVLAVVTGPEDAVGGYVSSLRPGARVVVGPRGSEIEKAFAVRGYPGFALVGDEAVVAASGGLGEVVEATKVTV